MKQIYPASITGKGFAAGGSVLDHRFGDGDPYTLGVEEEYMLLDGETFDLVQHIETVLAAAVGHELETRINAELMQSVLEIATPVCRNAGDVDEWLRKLRSYVCEIARERGLRVGSAGTHPFSLFERQRITARDRYRNLVDQMQYIARRELIFGLHVHVAVDEPEKAIAVMNGLALDVPILLGLSGSSPFWRGEATGFSSIRQMVFAAFPRSGMPPYFRDYADYAEVIGQLEKTGCIADYTHIWWDVRSRCGSATQSRGSRTRSRSPPTARRSSSSTRSGTSAARRSPSSIACCRRRTSGSPPATASARR